MNKEQIINAFVEEIKNISESWTREIGDGRDPVHKYADQIFHLHQVLEEIIKEQPSN